jgi:hypothetical protein
MRYRIERWKQVYDTEENAITRTLSKMAWDLVAFSCLVEVVRQAPDTQDAKHLNGMFIDMLASGFWASTMQGIRRLVEKGPIEGHRGVCSLGSLIQDARAARSHLTREVYVCDIAGLPYNYEKTREQGWAYLTAHPPGEAVWMPREIQWEPSGQRHVEFDWLSGSEPGNSTPADLIREEVLIGLEVRLSQLEGIVEHVNVEIAHSATEASRQGRVLDQWRLSDAKVALKELAQIAELVGRWFCYSGIGTVLPHPQFDQFEHLDKPLFTGDVGDLREAWERFDADAREWHSVDAGKFLDHL